MAAGYPPWLWTRLSFRIRLLLLTLIFLQTNMTTLKSLCSVAALRPSLPQLLLLALLQPASGRHLAPAHSTLLYLLIIFHYILKYFFVYTIGGGSYESLQAPSVMVGP